MTQKFKKMLSNGKCPYLGVKISHIATVKYATTRRAFLGMSILYGLLTEN
jgi:hypothetical protein